jgi:hypothetical protein
MLGRAGHVVFWITVAISWKNNHNDKGKNGMQTKGYMYLSNPVNIKMLDFQKKYNLKNERKKRHNASTTATGNWS